MNTRSMKEKGNFGSMAVFYIADKANYLFIIAQCIICHIYAISDALANLMRLTGILVLHITRCSLRTVSFFSK